MSKLIIVVFSLLGLISACVGQIVQNGQCDENIAVVPNLNAANFAGVWYDIESLPSTFQSGTCNTATYTPNADGSLSVQNTQVANSLLQIVTGTAVPTGNAKFDVTISGNTPPVPYWILATDYTTYALIYSCSNINGQTRRVNSWKLGRNKGALPLAATNAINSVITNVAALNAVSNQFIQRDHSAAACSYFVDFDGPCPTVGGVANFDVARYLGTWYEVARYPQTSQTGQCNRAEYVLESTAGVVNVQNSQVTNEALGTITGTATQVPGQSGVLQVTFIVGGEVRQQNLHVLATDYDNYALVYSCTPLTANRRRIGSWQLRKNTNALDQTAINAINAAIAATPDLQAGYYQETSQTDAACFYYPDFEQLPATIELPGPCDTSITGVAGFDVARYLGTWYEVARYPQPTQTGQCNRAQYTLGAGSVTVLNSQVIDETLATIIGIATVTAQPGVLQVAYIVGGEVRTQNLYVLATDYENYALAYTCTNIAGNRRQVGSWKLSRNTNPLSAAANTAINTVIAYTQGLRQDYYQETSQTDAACFYYPVFEQPPATIELPGPCDTSITGVAGFDVARYLGTWYEVARYPQPTQTGQCNRAQYALEAAIGVVTVQNSQVTNEALGTISGTATQVPGQSGVLQVTFIVGNEVRTQNLYVLATDYENYALAYTCTNIAGNRRQVGSWKLSRNTNPLSAAANTAINTVIAYTQGLRQDYYQETSQTDAACFYYPVFEQPPATIELPGPCDTSITGVAGFDVARYLGTWYEVARYPQPTQTGQCNRAQYALEAAIGVVTVQNSQVTNEALGTISGTATQVPGQSGVLQVTFIVGNEVRTQNLYVLATDYENYALAYTCTNIAGNRRQVGSWKLSRNTNPLSAAANTAINTVIAYTQGLRQDYYQETSQTDAACFYYPVFEQPPATIELPGPCDTSITGVAGFDVARYLGTWYEVARYPQPTQTGQCNRAQYALEAAIGVVTVQNSQVTNEALGTISGTATQVPGQSGVLQVTFIVGNEVRTQNLYVLATDYENYALAYTCTNIAGNRRQVGSWKLSRNTNPLSAAANTAINTVIANTQGLRQDYYQETRQTDAACFYYPDFEQLPAIIELPGPCDSSITGVADFDVNRYLGTWYEVARYPQPTQTGQCNRAQYALVAATGSVDVLNSQVINETLATIIGIATATAQPGVLQVAFIVGGEVRNQNLYVLATDYENYALAYTCTNIVGNRRQVGSWKLSRNTNPLSAAANTAINTVIARTQGLRQNYYQETSQTDAACFYYPVFEQPPATIELPGPCDTSITGVPDFDVIRYLGTWYEVARYPQPTQTGQCNRAQYTLGAGSVTVLNSQVIDETLATIIGMAVTAQPGVLQVAFIVGGEVRTQNLYVLATDYDNFALVYTCTNIEGNRRQVGSWILSRNRNPLSEEANTVINNVVATVQDLRQEYYQETSQTDEACWHYLPQTGDKVIIPGQCDTSISGVANIDLTGFANSTWYQIQRYDAVGEDSSCIGSRLSYDGSYINVNSIEVIGGEVKHTEGVARLTAADSGKFSLQMADTEDPEEIYILATDYHGYAIAYSCKNSGTNNRQIGAWQLSRGRTMPPAGEAAVDTLVATRQEFTRALTYFKPISHAGDCPEPSSAFLF